MGRTKFNVTVMGLWSGNIPTEFAIKASTYCTFLETLGPGCGEVPPEDVCCEAADCPDDNDSVCIGSSCVDGECVEDTIDNCCELDVDCTEDTDVCTDIVCNLQTNRCETNDIPNCCTAEGDCTEDNDVCTDIVCNLQTNRCETNDIANCCERDNDCP